LEGFRNGADGIFTGGWHLGECHYRSGNYEAINKYAVLKIILENLGIDDRRLALEWVSAAEAPLFVGKVTRFTEAIRDLGPLGEVEGLDRETLMRKIEAAKLAVSGMKLRLTLARQAKKIKEEGTYGEFPDQEKLLAVLGDEMTLNETWLCLQKKERSAAELSELLSIPEEQVLSAVETLRKKKMWDGTLAG
jgi:F420-non-reducing hydrogenase iron-sulfur subunit